jgi:hypothetical protein
VIVGAAHEALVARCPVIHSDAIKYRSSAAIER